MRRGKGALRGAERKEAVGVDLLKMDPKTQRRGGDGAREEEGREVVGNNGASARRERLQKAAAFAGPWLHVRVVENA